MSGRSSLDDLSIEELEEILEAKRRARALKRFRRVADGEDGEPSDLAEVARGRRESSAGLAAYQKRGRTPEADPSRTPTMRVASTEHAVGDEGTAFKTVKIVPEGRVVDDTVSLLSRINKRFWLKGFPRLRDRLLLLLELAALAGLIFVIFSSLSDLRLLNKEVAEALGSEHITTPVATPAQMLPGGSHRPATEGAVPGQYLHLVEPGASIPIPTPGPRQASRILIEGIGVNAPVVEGDGWEELKMGAGHRIGSGNPGERGNMVISGHNDVYGEIFRYLADVSIGDAVIVYTGDTPHSYVVVAKMVVEPTEVSLLEPTPNSTLTLITCHPYMIDTHRLVVIAELANQ